ncbi:hypothetical protein HanPSC8_Chr08g0308611 [Helianthus annuus]|nr:hypothetical protein HanPSC8_Chr08g0308611 [Helianthus annuus]
MEMHSTMTWRCGYNFLRHQHVVQVDYTTFIKQRLQDRVDRKS